MPEGDTVLRTARRLHEALAGLPLLDADLRWPGLSTANLRGMTVLEVIARGKHVLTRLDSGWTLHSHLRMEGQWRVERTAGAASMGNAWMPAAGSVSGRPSATGKGEPRSDPPLQRSRAAGPGPYRASLVTHPDVRAILVGPEWTAIGLRLGMLDLVRTDQEHTLVGHLGPDILDPDFDLGRAVANLAASQVPIGAALLDQRNLGGIGTLWSSETLFVERVDPWTAADQLGREVLTRLVDRARRLMLANTAFAIQSSTGNRVEGQTSYVHARSGRPCRRCGGTVRVAAIGPPTQERTMFYCPGCQGGLAPTDDGRPLAPLGARRREVPGKRGLGP